jgi:putative ABC transport system permease protein
MISVNLTSETVPERIGLCAVTTNYFNVLGQPPAMGRTFHPDDAGGNVSYVVVISHDAWMRIFNGDPEVIGKTVRLDDDPITIIGVMPERFEHPGESGTDRISAWIAVDLIPEGRFDNRGFKPFTLIGRLAPGSSIEASRAEFTSIAAELRSEYPRFYPESSGWTVLVEPLFEQTVGEVRPALVILLVAVGLVLLTACANVASLLLTRGQGRAREIAIRTAIGAPRRRIIRQLLTETLLLVLLGCAGGLAVAAIGLRFLRAIALTALPRLGEFSLDGTVLGYALAVSLLTGLAFGLFPAFHASRSEPHGLLREGWHVGSRRKHVRGVLVSAQVALSLMLVVGAGLLTRSLFHLMDRDPGFNPESVLAVQTWLPIPNDPETGRFRNLPDRVGFADSVLRELNDNPAVTDAAITSMLPFRGLAGSTFRIEGEDRAEGEAAPVAQIRQVSPGYFSLMGIPLHRGRSFSDTDDADAPLVVVVDRRLADRWFAGDPIGRRVLFRDQPLEIVGVVGNVREDALETEARPHIYINYRQSIGLNISFVLKTATAPELLAGYAREAVQRVDPDQPVFGVSPMVAVISEALSRERLLMTLLLVFAVASLALAAVGIYGVVAYALRQRYREIGLRMALGATPHGLLRMLLWEGMRVTAVGAIAGLVAAIFATGVLSAVLHGVDKLDPATFLVAMAVTTTVAIVASVVPAWSVLGMDPAKTLRDG